jgi:hypothetical protein
MPSTDASMTEQARDEQHGAASNNKHLCLEVLEVLRQHQQYRAEVNNCSASTAVR